MGLIAIQSGLTVQDKHGLIFICINTCDFGDISEVNFLLWNLLVNSSREKISLSDVILDSDIFSHLLNNNFRFWLESLFF